MNDYGHSLLQYIFGIGACIILPTLLMNLSQDISINDTIIGSVLFWGYCHIKPYKYSDLKQFHWQSYCPAMTIAVDLGRKASKQTSKTGKVVCVWFDFRASKFSIKIAKTNLIHKKHCCHGWGLLASCIYVRNLTSSPLKPVVRNENNLAEMVTRWPST